MHAPGPSGRPRDCAFETTGPGARGASPVHTTRVARVCSLLCMRAALLAAPNLSSSRCERPRKPSASIAAGGASSRAPVCHRALRHGPWASRRPRPTCHTRDACPADEPAPRPRPSFDVSLSRGPQSCSQRACLCTFPGRLAVPFDTRTVLNGQASGSGRPAPPAPLLLRAPRAAAAPVTASASLPLSAAALISDKLFSSNTLPAGRAGRALRCSHMRGLQPHRHALSCTTRRAPLRRRRHILHVCMLMTPVDAFPSRFCCSHCRSACRLFLPAQLPALPPGRAAAALIRWLPFCGGAPPASTRPSFPAP